MKSIRTHLGVILPMICLLFSVQFILFVKNVVADYQKVITNSYNIVLVARKDLSSDRSVKFVREVQSIEPIDPSTVLSRLGDKISDENREKIASNLPYFYNVTLKFFPSNRELEMIGDKLRTLDGVTKVEVFSKSHDMVYSVFLLFKNTLYVFVALVIILGLVVLLKQMRIWVYEHRNRMEIIDYFGAPFAFKSRELYQIAVIDALIACAIVVAIYLAVPQSQYIGMLSTELGMEVRTISLFRDVPILICVALLIALLSVSAVMSKITKEQR